jgi:hypothetical protein
MQAKKTKDLESIPTFSIGLTPLEEEQSRKDKNQTNMVKEGEGQESVMKVQMIVMRI